YAGSGFRDFTRIAASSPTMWVEIFRCNRENLLVDLEKMIDLLVRYRDLIEREDYIRLYERLEKSSELRKSLIFPVKR
ncbi:MAG: prephenate dehydrogenase dimerization domain-containing protein, partial [Thermosulfidibacteraceae bacterium]